MLKNNLNWNQVKHYFEDDGMLTDIVINKAKDLNWKKLLNFLLNNKDITISEANIFDACNNQNLENIPNHIFELIKDPNSTISINFTWRNYFNFSLFRFIFEEIEISIATSSINNEFSFDSLMEFIDIIRSSIDLNDYFISPESRSERKFIENGKFIGVSSI